MAKIDRRPDVNPKEGEREYGDVAFEIGRAHV